MSCPICFFREKTQKELKKSTFGTSRFENKLHKYKKRFIGEVDQMKSLSNCSCSDKYENEILINWTDDFQKELKNERDEIENAFNKIISIYESSIANSRKIATDELWDYLSEEDLLKHAEGASTYNKLLFRGRAKDNFDENNIHEYFHIPFNKRHLVGNQRFSVSGQPMLYFSSSVLTVTKELEKQINDIAVAGFLPDYYTYFYSRIFSLTNHLAATIENALPGITAYGSQIDYYQSGLSPNRASLVNDIHRTVFMHLCTFPTEIKGNYVPEYAIPQMLTSALLNHGYDGLIFPSTKNYSNLTGNHRFSSHHKNVALPYDRDNDVNISLLDTFKCFLTSNSKNSNLKPGEIVEKAHKINLNDGNYITSLANLELHIEYLKNAKISGVDYFETKIGKLELHFYSEMLDWLDD